MNIFKKWFVLSTVLFVASVAQAGTIEGKIVDRQHDLLKYFMESGVPWNGKFDRISSPMVNIIAYKGDTVVGRTHPKEDGAFEMQTTDNADKIVLAVPDGGYYLVKGGYWGSRGNVELNVGSINAFVISGTVTKNGSPARYQGVSALDENGRTLTRVTSRTDGSFEVHTSVPVAEIKTYYASLKGPWRSSSRVKLGN